MIMISDRATTDTIAPPTPCTALATMRNSCEFARPQKRDATVKTAMPIRNKRR
jgi:hypothetical protein